MNDGNYIDAKNELTALLADEPGYGRAHNHLGWLYENQIRDNAKADYHYGLALKFAPDYVPVYLNYIWFLFEQGQLEKHRALIDTAMAVAGVCDAALLNELGRSDEISGNFRSAARNYKRAVDKSIVAEELEVFQNNRKRALSKLSLIDRLVQRCTNSYQ